MTPRRTNVEIGNEIWIAEEIDGTHLTLARDEENLHGAFNSYHIQQLRDEPYYDELKEWLINLDGVKRRVMNKNYGEKS